MIFVFLIFWEALTIGGSAYIVFWKGHSAWWLLLGIFLGLGTIKFSTKNKN